MPVYSVKGHKEIINAIDGVGGLGIGEGAPEIVTGSRDGTVKVWDPRQKDDPVANMEPVQGENKRDCWTVAFGNAYNQEERVVCAGYDNGDIKLFDLRNMALRWETNIKNGVCSLEFDRKDISMNKLVATSLEGKFHVFDMRTQHPTKGFASVSEKAHKSTVWQVRHLPQNRELFLTAGGAGGLHLWKYEYPIQRSKKDSEGIEMGVAGSVSLLQNVTLSTQPISSLDWSPDKRGLCVCSSFDQTVSSLGCSSGSTVTRDLPPCVFFPRHSHEVSPNASSSVPAPVEPSHPHSRQQKSRKIRKRQCWKRPLKTLLSISAFEDGPRPSSPDPSPSAVLLHLPEEPLNTPIPPRSWGASQFNKSETENSMQTTPLLRGDKGKVGFGVELGAYLKGTIYNTHHQQGRCSWCRREHCEGRRSAITMVSQKDPMKEYDENHSCPVLTRDRSAANRGPFIFRRL
ncbi:WD repeat-containing protein 92 isoform X2 [Trachypithecus francoisi]|nr:WD repeat-containing protein 92 isoform X2 [Trachypithecus francoisi]